MPISAKADTQRSAPLHIKIGGVKDKGTGIRIHKGLVPVRNIATLAALPLTSKSNSIPLRSTEAEAIIDASISCAMNRATPMSQNRIKNLADSLKAYMRAEKLDPNLIDTLQVAARETNTDFELLVAKAMLESDLGRQIKSPVSTARGVFQYVEATWLSLIKRHGARIGYPNYAEAIEIDAKTGQSSLKRMSTVSKADILDLRFNPYSAAMIKGLQIREESATVQSFKDNQRLSATDHYIAHMMGLSLAEEFYKLKNQESNIILAHSPNPLFREAVALNPYFFFDEKHRALTATQAYSHFKSRIASTYERLRKIEAQYGAGKVVANECETAPLPPSTMPAVEAAKVEKPEMLPAKGITVAAIENDLLKTTD